MQQKCNQNFIIKLRNLFKYATQIIHYIQPTGFQLLCIWIIKLNFFLYEKWYFEKNLKRGILILENEIFIGITC
jgi:hypothetical protein